MFQYVVDPAPVEIVWPRLREIGPRLTHALRLGVFLGLSAAAVTALLVYWLNPVAAADGVWWIDGLYWGGVFGLVVCLITLVSAEIESRREPNEGTRSSARSAAVLFILAWAIVVLLLSRNAVGALLKLPGLSETADVTWGARLFIGLCAAVMAALYGGGLSALRHAILRLALVKNRVAPLRYIRFLDFASERLLLRKVGNGYIFTHRLLMEYFASLRLNAGTFSAPVNESEVALRKSWWRILPRARVAPKKLTVALALGLAAGISTVYLWRESHLQAEMDKLARAEKRRKSLELRFEIASQLNMSSEAFVDFFCKEAQNGKLTAESDAAWATLVSALRDPMRSNVTAADFQSARIAGTTLSAFLRLKRSRAVDDLRLSPVDLVWIQKQWTLEERARFGKLLQRAADIVDKGGAASLETAYEQALREFAKEGYSPGAIPKGPNVRSSRRATSSPKAAENRDIPGAFTGAEGLHFRDLCSEQSATHSNAGTSK